MSNQFQAEIAEISVRLDEIEDPRQSYALVRERIRQRQAAGEIVPDELTRMERILAVECQQASQGR